MILILQGAYGREPTLSDFAAGKDFKIWYGPYTSIRDLPRIKRDGYTAIEFRKRDGTLTATLLLTTKVIRKARKRNHEHSSRPRQGRRQDHP